MAYLPAGNSLPPNRSGASVVSRVAEWDPVTHSRPYGTTLPQMARPRTAGEWYSISIWEAPTLPVVCAMMLSP
ncbi:hypothetical protein GCM10023183_27890 [Nibribacter koreensis]|uniref:Uncharacterized protein n=1 Tax=Nibribacter koreensis TaxID=1084519 RepID=A0ABP8FSL2_9BACT